MTLQKIEFEYDIPDGYRFVRYAIPNRGDSYLNKGIVCVADYDHDCEWPIVEKIPEEEQNNKQKFQYRPSSKEEWIDLYDGYEYRIKPKTKTVRFRNYLTINNFIAISRMNNPDYFVKWLGDWQEVEVEE